MASELLALNPLCIRLTEGLPVKRAFAELSNGEISVERFESLMKVNLN